MSQQALALLMPEPLVQFYAPALRRLLPDVAVRAEVQDERFENAEYVLAIAPPPGRLAAMPNLRCVIAPGAGVDHVLADPGYPRNIPLVRMVQPDLLQRMKEYVLLHVLRHHRRAMDYEAQQRAMVWRNLWPQKSASERSVGVLGLGELGGPIAADLAAFGFQVRGWSKQSRTLDGVECHHGFDGLRTVLATSEILVNLLPATPETFQILNAERLGILPAGACLVNAGRGATVDEEALLAALDSGKLDGATLDVFVTEPLPVDHPFWRHPRVTVTPHCASAVTPEAMATGIRRIMIEIGEGNRPEQAVDLSRGY